MKRRRLYPRPRVDARGTAAVSQAGGALLVETIRAAGLDEGLSTALQPWRKPGARHDPAKVLLDLAVAVALGGDCLADAAVVRAEPAVFGSVASDATISRAVAALARDAGTTERVLAAVDGARAAARARVWRLAEHRAPDHDVTTARPLVVDVDGVLVTAHSDKEQAAPTFKKGFGHHPLVAFVDHGPDGTGEPVGVLLRKGNAGSNTATDHVTVLRQALRQLPGVNASAPSVGRRVPHAYVVVSLLTGARTEELRALLWTHVDLIGRPDDQPPVPPTMAVWQSVRAMGDTKTRLSRRTLALPTRCVEVLTTHRKKQDLMRAEAGPKWIEMGLVFTTRIGTPLDAADVRRDFRAAIRRAPGIDAGAWTPRELRHSFVSLLSDSGVPIEEISRLVGHRSTLVTETVYRKQLRPVIQSGATAMDRLFATDSAGVGGQFGGQRPQDSKKPRTSEEERGSGLL